MLHAGKASQ